MTRIKIRIVLPFFLIIAAAGFVVSCGYRDIDTNDWYVNAQTDDETQLEENMLKKNYYIIFDGSGSMAQANKIDDARTAVKKFIKAIPPSANIALFAFDSVDTSERAPLGSSRELILEKIDDIKVGGYTPLGKSLEVAYEMLKIQGYRQLGYGEYNIVVITDGIASNKSKLRGIVKEILRNSPVTIHTIGFKIRSGHTLNKKGRINYKSAQNLEELTQGLGEVLAELEDFSVKEF